MADALALMQWEEQGLVRTQQKLAEFVQYFQATLEINSEGFPMSLIDPTAIAECIPYSETTDDIPEERLALAIRRVDYEDGVPCVDGLPIWERLDGETIPYYKVFKEYRDMKYVNDTNHNTRSMARLAETLNVPGRLVSILSRIYHWAPRVKAYDKQREYEIALKKQRNIEELEFKHAKYSNEILDQAIKFLEKNPKAIDGKLALQMIELGMKYGRISAGLLGDKPGTHSSVAAAQAAAGVHQTNIAISQTNTHNEAGQMLNVTSVGGVTQGGANGQGGSAVERQLQANMKDTSQLVSVLHILNQSGAFKAATLPSVEETEEEEASRYDLYDDGTALHDIIELLPEEVNEIGAIDDDDAALNINNKAVPGVGERHA